MTKLSFLKATDIFLTQKNVITAAHCCAGEKPNGIKVVAGEHNLFVDEGTEQTLKVSHIVMHKNYNPSTIENDICLLQLASAADFST